MNSADELNEVMLLLLIHYLLAFTNNIASCLNYKSSLGVWLLGSEGLSSRWQRLPGVCAEQLLQ